MNKVITNIIAFCVFLVLCIALFICSYICEVSLLFTSVLIIWTGVLIYTFTDIKRHIVLFCFLVSFFVFLIGRELCFAYFGLGRYYRYLEKYNNATFGLMSISMITLMMGYKFADNYNIKAYKLGVSLIHRGHANKRIQVIQLNEYYDQKKIKMRKASSIAYYFCLLCSLIEVVLKIRLVGVIGYLGTYVESNVSSPTILGYVSSFTIVALSIYLSTCPRKRITWFTLLLYEFYAILTMLTGHRYTFVAISMYNMTYVVYRHKVEGRWISKKFIVGIILALPFVLVIMNNIDAVRTGQDSGNRSLINTIVSFLDGQGGSINVIKRVMYYKDKLSDMVLTSFSNTRTVLLENAVIRRLTGIKVYSGNSIDNALHGHFLSHRLSYYEYGSYYLSGHGTGSSYIAELYLDFGWIGVIIGNIIYGYAISRVTDIDNQHYIRNALIFASQYYLYLAPRGDFDGMIGGLFSIVSILGMLGIWMLSHIFRTKEQLR